MLDDVARYDPDWLIAKFGLATALFLALVRWVQRIRASVPPDPWSGEIDKGARAKAASPLCTNCLFPQTTHRWFCSHCGFPTGEYVTAMPYLYTFALGEFMRRGVWGSSHRHTAGLATFALVAPTQYFIFVPLYWFWLLRKASGRPIAEPQRIPLEFEEE